MDIQAPDLVQFDAYQTRLSPLYHYSQQNNNQMPSENDIKRFLSYAKQTNFILESTREIINDLHYDKEQFKNLISPRIISILSAKND